MSIQRSSQSGTERVWKLMGDDSHHVADKRIPRSWAENGAREPRSSPDDVRVYAIRVKVGSLLEWTVDQSGTVVDGPHRERTGLRTLYVSADGQRATVYDHFGEPVRGGGQLSVKPDATHWTSVRAVAPDRLDDVEARSHREAYRQEVADLYDVAENGGGEA